MLLHLRPTIIFMLTIISARTILPWSCVVQTDAVSYLSPSFLVRPFRRRLQSRPNNPSHPKHRYYPPTRDNNIRPHLTCSRPRRWQKKRGNYGPRPFLLLLSDCERWLTRGLPGRPGRSRRRGGKRERRRRGVVISLSLSLSIGPLSLFRTGENRYVWASGAAARRCDLHLSLARHDTLLSRSLSLPLARPSHALRYLYVYSIYRYRRVNVARAY